MSFPLSARSRFPVAVLLRRWLLLLLCLVAAPCAAESLTSAKPVALPPLATQATLSAVVTVDQRPVAITTDGVVTESLPFPNSAPLGITAGRRTQVWFLGNGSNRVYRTVFP